MEYKHILALTDFSKFSDKSVEFAAKLAKLFGSELTVLHVAHDESNFGMYLSAEEYNNIKEKIDKEVTDKFNELESKIPALKDVDWTVKVRRGTPYIESLIEIEENGYDLAVLGSHGETGLRRFFYGSTTEKILRNCPISLHVTKPEED